MDKAVAAHQLEQTARAAGAEMRAAPRFTLLIRAAKLVSAQGEFVCVIRDVSELGVSVRLFHALPPCKHFELHMPAGPGYAITCVWQRGNEAGFTFDQRVEVPRLISESAEYPRRGLRLAVCFPITLTTLTNTCEAAVENLSQQGARIACDSLFAIDQILRFEAPSVAGAPRPVRAKIRWRRDAHYGLVFDDTFALGDFARLAAQLQAPTLLEG